MTTADRRRYGKDFVSTGREGDHIMVAEVNTMLRNTRTRAAGAAVAALAALTLSVGVPTTADAQARGGPVQVALIAPGQLPLPCAPGRWKCPQGSGLL